MLEVGQSVLNGGQTEYMKMGIHVILTNNDTGNVNGNTLDNLLRKKEVVAFRRSEGWVQIGRDPIRYAQQPLTKSHDRRSGFMSKRTEY